jgi:hypothetical protein
MSKKSIRFYNDHEVRAVWDEENAKELSKTEVPAKLLYG